MMASKLLSCRNLRRPPAAWAMFALGLVSAGLAGPTSVIAVFPTVASAGGGRSSGGKFVMSGTVAQPGAAPTTSTKRFSVASGFWNLPAVVQVGGASVQVTLGNERMGVPLPAVVAGPESVDPVVEREAEGLGISWSTAAGDFMLEASADISDPAQWMVVESWKDGSSGRRHAWVPVSEAQRFFRLRPNPAAP